MSLTSAKGKSSPSSQQLSKSKIKKKIRDTERLLRQKDLPPQITVDQERKLKALKLSLDEGEKTQKEIKIFSRYKMVRFFERKKLARKFIQTKKQLTACTVASDKSKLESKLSLLERQLNYVVVSTSTYSLH